MPDFIFSLDIQPHSHRLPPNAQALSKIFPGPNTPIFSGAILQSEDEDTPINQKIDSTARLIGGKIAAQFLRCHTFLTDHGGSIVYQLRKALRPF